MLLDRPNTFVIAQVHQDGILKEWTRLRTGREFVDVQESFTDLRKRCVKLKGTFEANTARVGSENPGELPKESEMAERYRPPNTTRWQICEQSEGIFDVIKRRIELLRDKMVLIDEINRIERLEVSQRDEGGRTTVAMAKRERTRPRNTFENPEFANNMDKIQILEVILRRNRAMRIRDTEGMAADMALARTVALQDEEMAVISAAADGLRDFDAASKAKTR